jgi:hypothetical protein
MQAPRITAFNGQTATLNVSDNQTFVTNVNVSIGPNGNPLFSRSSRIRAARCR